MYNHVVGRVERLAVVALGERSDLPIVFVPGHAASSVLAGDLAPFEIESVAVAVAGGTAKYGYMVVLFHQPHLAIVWNIAPDHKVAFTRPGRTLGPTRADEVPIDDGVEDRVFCEGFI